MKPRLRKFVALRVQLKMLTLIMLITALTFALTLGLFYKKTENQNRKITATISSIKESVDTEDKIIKAFVKYSKRVKSRDYRLKTRNIFKDHDLVVAKLKNEITTLEGFLAENKKTIKLMIIIFAFQFVILFVVIRFYTHKIAGPLYVMQKYMNELKNGRNPTIRPLRKRDELKAFYDDFTKLIDKK